MASEENSTVDASVEAASQIVSDKVETAEHYLQLLADNSVQFATSLLLAIVVWIVGQWLIKRIIRVAEVAMDKRKVEITLHNFLVNIISFVLKRHFDHHICIDDWGSNSFFNCYVRCRRFSDWFSLTR